MTTKDILPKYLEARINEFSAQFAQTPQNQLLFESVHRRADGSVYPVEASLQLVTTTGMPTCLAIVRDITKRKTLQSQLQRAQRLESIGQLAAGIAHEINTPTQFVSDNIRFIKDAFVDLQNVSAAYTKLLDEARTGRVDPALIEEVDASIKTADAEYLSTEVPEAIDQSLNGMEHIARIVRAMKEFSHPGEDEKKPADLHVTIRNVITVSSNEWKYVAEVNTQFDQELGMVPCHFQELSQALLNIIVNASHAIDEKNASRQGEKGQITIVTRKIEDTVEIRVSDTGNGISEDIKEHVFDPFFTTKCVGKGTGQGLAIAHASIVEKHGGSITVETELGIGTTFIINLPLTDDSLEANAAAA